MGDINIKISDLLFRILQKWRLILLCAIICAAAADAYCVYKNRSEIKRIKILLEEYEEKKQVAEEAAIEMDEEEKLYEESVISLDEYEENLTPNQVSEVQSIVSMYRMYQKPYADTMEYIDHSIRMQLDPNAVPTMIVQYLIDTHFSVEYPEITKRDYTDDIRNSIYHKLVQESLLNKMAKRIGEDVSPAYMRELIGTSTIGDDIYQISVVGRSEMECRALMEIIKAEIPAVMQRQQKAFGDFDYAMISENYYVTYNQDILNAQKSQADIMRTLRTTTSDMIEKLTNEQKTYFYALINNDESITLQLPVEKEPSDQVEELIDPTTLVMPTPKIFYGKYIILGAVFGAFLVCMYTLCVNLFGGKLISAENLEDAYNIPSLGMLRISPEPKGVFSGIDKWLVKVLDGRGCQFSFEEHLAMITAGIRLSAAKNGWNKVYVTGTANDEGTSQAVATICKCLQGKVEQVSAGRSIIYDPESLDAMTQADATVIVERTDVSRYDEIHREYALCLQHKVPVLGYVTLK